jgi:thiol-disulfide isomerase/thioredoxin
MIRKILIFLFFIGIIVLFSYQGCKAPEAANSSLPTVELQDLSGKKIKLSEFSGKPLVLNLWATWCGPCRFEIPMLNDLHKKYSDKGLVIVGISTDEDGTQLVKDFMKETPIQYPSYLKTPGLEEQFGGIWALPTTYFYDRTGKQVDKIIGVQTPEYFEKQIQRILK